MFSPQNYDYMVLRSFSAKETDRLVDLSSQKAPPPLLVAKFNTEGLLFNKLFLFYPGLVILETLI